MQSVMHHALHDVLTTVAASEAHLHFSVCQDCAYLQNMLRLNKCDRVGPRVPTLQRSDRAGGCSAPLRSFSAKGPSTARTQRMNSGLPTAEKCFNAGHFEV